mmetsp:Transcript_122437/g.346165  ORF Transcript_122437/g.346165 Transcript_122437/m.346165 type:complete len:216 (-) Transcript_122437:89-736(-)
MPTPSTRPWPRPGRPRKFGRRCWRRRRRGRRPTLVTCRRVRRPRSLLPFLCARRRAGWSTWRLPPCRRVTASHWSWSSPCGTGTHARTPTSTPRLGGSSSPICTGRARGSLASSFQTAIIGSMRCRIERRSWLRAGAKRRRKPGCRGLRPNRTLQRRRQSTRRMCSLPASRRRPHRRCVHVTLKDRRRPTCQMRGLPRPRKRRQWRCGGVGLARP